MHIVKLFYIKRPANQSTIILNFISNTGENKQIKQTKQTNKTQAITEKI